MTKSLGKKPPQELCRDHGCDNPCEHHIEKEAHYRQALIETSDELEYLIPRVKGIITNPDHVRLCVLVKQIKKSAGVEG